MRQKKVKHLRRLFRGLNQDDDPEPIYNIRGEVVENNKWRQFKQHIKKHGISQTT